MCAIWNLKKVFLHVIDMRYIIVIDDNTIIIINIDWHLWK